MKALHAGRVARTFLAIDEGAGGGEECVSGAVTERRVSLKVLQPFADVEEQRLRLLREAELQELCAHPAIVAVRAAGRVDKRVFVAREYVAGLTLGELVRRSASRSLPLIVIAAVGECLLEALEQVHERLGPEGRALGLVHRDVTLENVLIGWDGSVRLTDFGLAYAPALHGPLADDEIPQGTRRYLPPEAARGELPDARSDLFQLALTLVEAGGVPLRGPSPSWRELGEVDLRSRVPASLGTLGELLAGALAADRAERYPSAAAMLGAWRKTRGEAPPAALVVAKWLVGYARAP